MNVRPPYTIVLRETDRRERESGSEWELDMRLHGIGLPSTSPNCAKTLFEYVVTENSDPLFMWPAQGPQIPNSFANALTHLLKHFVCSRLTFTFCLFRKRTLGFSTRSKPHRASHRHSRIQICGQHARQRGNAYLCTHTLAAVFPLFTENSYNFSMTCIVSTSFRVTRFHITEQIPSEQSCMSVFFR